MACLCWLPILQLLHKSVQCIECGVGLFPFGQFCHCKAKGIMKVGVQSMVETVLLQIPPSIRKALWVCASNNHNCIMYAEHVLLHHLILLLLNLIQCPYHGIIVMFVTKHLLHVHQQVLHQDILAFIQGAGPFTRVPTEAGKDMWVHTGLIILLKEGIHIKMPECVHHFRTWISRLEDIQSYPILQEPTAPYSLYSPCIGADGLQPCLQWNNHQSLALPCLV